MTARLAMKRMSMDRSLAGTGAAVLNESAMFPAASPVRPGRAGRSTGGHGRRPCPLAAGAGGGPARSGEPAVAALLPEDPAQDWAGWAGSRACGAGRADAEPGL